MTATTAPLPSSAVPTSDYERFLAAMPETMRADCEARLAGSGLAANHPVFHVLAELYEDQQRRPARDFVAEAVTHSDLSKKLLEDFKAIPALVVAEVEPKLAVLLQAFEAPVGKLEVAATSLERNVEALPVLLLGEPAEGKAQSDAKPAGLPRYQRRIASAPPSWRPWIISGAISFTLALVTTLIVLAYGADHLSRSYEHAYQERVAHIEADSVANTVALNRLLTVGLTLQLERGSNASDWFLVLKGARKISGPLDSADGPAIELHL